MTNIFPTYLGISATVGIVVLLILLASPFINRRYAAKWKYFIWIFLAIRLLIPVSGMYHKESKSPAVNETVQSSGTVVYESTQIQTVQPRRFVVEIPVEAKGQITHKPDVTGARPKFSLFDIAFAAWIAGAVIFAAVPLLSCLHYKYRITRNGERIEDGGVSDTLQQLKSQLKIKRSVSLIRFSQAASPMIIGFIRPVLVLPCDEYSDEELQFIIRHELIHLKRGDVYIKLLCVLANAVHWFNPLIWIMRREAAIDMELSCDEGVIKDADFGVKKAYTETLMSSLRRQSAKRSSLTTQFYGGKGTMKKRFTNILGRGAKKNGIIVLICAVLLATVLGVVVGCTQKADIPSGDELNALIDRYLEFEGICTYTNLPADFDNPPSDDPSSEEHWIYPVTKEGLTTWEDWLSYLGGIFTESGRDKALEKTATRYINHNGNLYYSDGGMGWQLSGEYCISGTKQNGSTAFTVEFWREYDPDFYGNVEREFRITALDFEYTPSGWRIADYSDRDSTPADSNPNLAGYNPFDAEDTPVANPEVTKLTEDETNRLIAEYLRFEQYTVHGCVSFTSEDPDNGSWIGDSFVQEIELDGSYLPSNEEGLTTWQEWLDFINGIFTPETAEKHLNELTGEGKRYMNVEGKLYVQPGGDMGWPYGDPAQASYETNDIGSEGTIEFWREDFLEEEKVYLITVLKLRLTGEGWRIDSVESHSSPGNDGFVPMQNEFSEDEMNRLIADYMRFESYFVCGSVDTAGDDVPMVGLYRKSVEPGLTTWQEWLDYIYGLLTEEAAQKCLDTFTGEGHRYINIDGDLYALDGGMGWYYGEPVQAAYKISGSEGIIEFWRKDGSEGSEWWYYVTALRIRLTDSGWRVFSANSYDMDLFDNEIRRNDYYTISQAYSFENYEPLLDKPIHIDESAKEVNKIYRSLMHEYDSAVSMLNLSVTEDVYVVDGVDQIGNLVEIDGVTYVPLRFDETPDDVKRVLRVVFTEQKSKQLYSKYFENNSSLRIIDGRFYRPTSYSEPPTVLINAPLESAEKISSSEIVASTTIDRGNGLLNCEVTFKLEGGEWKIDKFVEDGKEVDY